MHCDISEDYRHEIMIHMGECYSVVYTMVFTIFFIINNIYISLLASVFYDNNSSVQRKRYVTVVPCKRSTGNRSFLSLAGNSSLMNGGNKM